MVCDSIFARAILLSGKFYSRGDSHLRTYQFIDGLRADRGNEVQCQFQEEYEDEERHGCSRRRSSSVYCVDVVCSVRAHKKAANLFTRCGMLQNDV